MVAVRTGNATPEKRKGREVLTLREPLVESLVHGLGLEGEQLAEVRRFCKDLTASRNRWDVRRRTGLFGNPHFSKSDAERAWRLAFAGGCKDDARLPMIEHNIPKRLRGEWTQAGELMA